jgi:hypothetical protein
MFNKILNIDGDVKINAKKVILWEVDLMTIQEYRIKLKFQNNMSILVVGYGYSQIHYKK